MMSNPVIILEGIVWYKEDVLYIGDQPLYKQLEPYADKRVTISAHHWPDDLNRYCFLHNTCQAHNDNPSFLFSWKQKGTLKGLRKVDNKPLPIEDLIGHHSRIILLFEGFDIPQPDSEDIINEAQKLTELLESLRQSLEELK